MALKSETLSPPNGVVNVTRKESGNEEDLEDGEIFDDEETAEVEAPMNAAEPVAKIPEVKERKKEAPHETSPALHKSDRKSSPEKRERRKSERKESSSRRKRSREDEEPESDRFPTKPNKHRKNREVEKREEEVDENELLCMRGGNSPTRLNHHHGDNHWDRYDSLDEDDEREGRDKGQRRMREGFNASGRIARRGRILRGGIKRRGMGRGGKMDREYSICKFYMQGKCQRGSECPFSHNALPPRKMELCKFYMNDCCAKKDKCLYMHNEFPCKYFHTGRKCYAGKRCKFSHGKISAQLRNALHMHLENSGGDDMMNDYPRHKREEMGMQEPHHHHHHHHHGGENRGGGGNNGGGNRGSDREGNTLDRGGSLLDRVGSMVERGGGQHPGGGPGHRGGRHPHHQQPHPHMDLDRIPSLFDLRLPPPEIDQEEEDGNLTPMPSPPAEIYKDRLCTPPEEGRPTRVRHDSGDSVEESEPPVHLPKKQRELFLRIQQQQRKADVVQDDKGDNAKEDEYGEENWYSSDEESSSTGAQVTPAQSTSAPSLNALLRTLGNADTKDSKMLLADIDLSAVSKLLSSVRETIQSKSESCETIKSPPSCSEERGQAPPPPPPHRSSTEEKRIRDPRLRGEVGAGNGAASAILSPEISNPHSSVDMDLRLSVPNPSVGNSDVDLRNLPFKPAPPHQAAKEIDASLNSHPVIDYKLVAFNIPKPDYSNIKPVPKNVNDPRLRKYNHSVASTTVTAAAISIPPPVVVAPPVVLPPPVAAPSRDPRAMKVPLAGDPRRKASVLLNTAAPAPLDDHQQNLMSMLGRDCDLRYPPPSPNVDDPRMLTHPSPFMPFPQRHSDVDLRVQTHSHYSYK